MRERLWLLGFGLALLLAACGGQGPGGENAPVRVTLLDPQNAFQGAYYRVGASSWQSLTFVDGQATFQASGEYQVVARCQDEVGGRIYHVKATPSQMRQVVIRCSSPTSAPSAGASLTVRVPPNIGGIPIADGSAIVSSDLSAGILIDGWFIIVPDVTVQSGQATLRTGFPPGVQDIVLAVKRNDDAPCQQPIGWKRVRLDVQNNGDYTIDENDWQPFAATRSINVVRGGSPASASAYVAYFKDGMKNPAYIGHAFGTTGCYGALPSGEGGVHLGFAVSSLDVSGSSSQRFIVLKDTGGDDWTVDMPEPWPGGALTVSGTTVSLSYPNALSYVLQASGFLKDAQTQQPLLLYATFFPGSGTTHYTPPDAGSVLGYTLTAADAYIVTAAAVVRGNAPSSEVLLDTGRMPSESALRGIDIAVAVADVGQGD